MTAKQPPIDFTPGPPSDTAGEGQPLDRVTVLQCPEGQFATKHVTIRDGQVVVTRGYDRITYWAWEQPAVSNIRELSALLGDVAQDPRCCIVRGDPLPGVASAGVRRRSNYDAETGDAPTFGPAPRYWVGFDFDDVELSAEVDLVADPERAIRLLIKERLPEAFHGVTCHWTLSSSAAPRSRRIHARPYFWMDRPVGDAEWKAWADANNVPASVKALFQCVQVHYTAAPIVEEGGDPIRRRFGLLEGERDAVTLPPTPFTEEHDSIDDGPRPEETPELVAQAIAHVALMPPSVHAPGNTAMWNATLALTRGFALGEETTLKILRENFNPRCVPPWEDDKLVHKASEGTHSATGPRGNDGRPVPLGYLLLCKCRGCEDATGGARQVTAESLMKYATQLSKSKNAHKSDLGALLLKVAAGEVFAEDVRQRGDAIDRMTRDLARHFRGYSARSIARLFERSLAKMKEKDPSTPEPEEVFENLRNAQKKIKGIVISTDIEAMQNKALAVLVEVGGYYQHGDAIMRIVKTTKPAARLKRDNESPVLRLAKFANVRKAVAKAKWFVPDGEELKPALPPDYAINSLLEEGDWPVLPNVESVSECPVMRPDGTVINVPGYDEKSGIYYLPNESYPAVPDFPTPEQVKAAIAAIDDVLHDFPFETEEHRGAVFAAILTLLGFSTFDEVPPLFLVEATKMGSGKDKLVRLIGIIGTGAVPYSASFTENDDEMKKLITSIAMAGVPIVNFANVTGTFGGANLCKVLTESHWGDRVLGENRYWKGILATTWFATGNNPQVGPDMPRRIVSIRLDWGKFGISDPHKIPASRWRHKDVIRYALRNRAKLVTAGLTILRYYFAAGAPEQRTSDWGSYETWSRIILGALAYAGLPDPGPARESFVQRANFAEDQKQHFVAGFAWLFDKVALGKPILAKEILRRLRERTGSNSAPGANDPFNFDFEPLEQYDLLTESLQALTLDEDAERFVTVAAPGGGVRRETVLPSAGALGKLMSSLQGALFDITPEVPLPAPPVALVEATATAEGQPIPGPSGAIGWKWPDGAMQWIWLGTKIHQFADGTTKYSSVVGAPRWVDGLKMRVRHYAETEWRRGPSGVEMRATTGMWVPQPRIQVRIVPLEKDKRSNRVLWGVEQVEYKPAHATT